jgi:ribose/xylose/arabinose/galactoside ABC-type transport system permease subunit
MSDKPVNFSSSWSRLKWPALALALVLVFNFFLTPGFFHLTFRDGRVYGSLVDIVNRGAPVILLSLGMTLVIATGGVDLSVGAVMAIAGAIAGVLITKNVTSMFVIIAVPLLVSLIAGAWNGALVGFVGVPPIVATLILMVAGRGVAQLLTNGQITFHNDTFAYIARGGFLGLPFPITLVIVAFVVLLIATQKTAAGLFIASVGDNELASRCAGLHTRRVKLFVYVVCGFMAGIAGLIPAADIQQADATHAGEWLELDAILATVIGGTALTGGKFSLGGALLGALLIQTVTTTILTRGVPAQLTLVVKALVVVSVCLLQSEKFRAFTVLTARMNRKAVTQ